MIRILFVVNIIVIIIAIVFFIIGTKNLKNDAFNKKGIKYVLACTNVIGTCIILSTVLFIPIFFPI